MKTRDLVSMAFLSAILLVAQVGLAFLPNIELVSLLVIIYTLLYKKKVFFILYTFAFIEGLIYGFGLWWVMYLYVWPLLAILVLLIEYHGSFVFWSVVSAIYGLVFGALCSIPYFISGGIGAGVAYWLSGIPFDLLHCAGNLGVGLVLFRPMYKVLSYCVYHQKEDIRK